MGISEHGEYEYMAGISKEQFAKGTVWKLFERFTGRGISLVISVVLARLLKPDDYGLIALAVVFTNLSEILIDAGFGTALIRKKEVDDGDYACVFTISCGISAVLYVILFCSAPVVSGYYERPELTALLRVMSLVLFIQAFATTRNVFVNRNMQFKLLMKCNTVAAVISGAAGITMAYLGITMLLLIKVHWKPKMKFDLEKFKSLFGFSAGVIGASLVNYVENCVNSLVVGKHYTVADLGYVDKAVILPEQIALNSFGAMTNVLLPTVSSYQSDIDRLRLVVRKVVRYTAYIMFPVMLGMLVVSREAIIVLFTEKWLPSVPMMQFMCIYYIATPLMLIDVQIFFGLGHSNTRLKTEIYRMIFILAGIVFCCFVFDLEIKYLSMTNAIAVSLGTVVTHLEVRKLIGYTLTDRLKDTYKSLIAALVMCAVVVGAKHILNQFSLPAIVLLIIEIVIGGLLYMFMSALLKIDVFEELLCLFKKKKSL